MSEPIQSPPADQEKLLLELIKRTEAIEQALIGLYSLLGEDATHRKQLEWFLKQGEENKDETSPLLRLRSERSQRPVDSPLAPLVHVLQKSLFIRLPPLEKIL